MLAMETVDAGKFRRLANQVGLLYSIRADKPDYDDMTVDGLTSVLYRQQDAPLVKSILERLHINTLVTAQTEDIAEITPEQQNALQNAKNPAAAPVTEEAPVTQQVDDMTAMQQVVRQQNGAESDIKCRNVNRRSVGSQSAKCRKRTKKRNDPWRRIFRRWIQCRGSLLLICKSN